MSDNVVMKKNESLRHRLSMPLGVVIFLAVMISSAIVSWAGFQRELAQQVELLNGNAKILSSFISEPLAKGDKRQVQLGLTSIGKFASFRFAAVEVADGTPYAEMGFDTYLKRNSETNYSNSNILFSDELWISDEIINSGVVIGTIRLLADVSNIKNGFFQNLLLNFAIAILSALVASRFSWILISKLTKPVTELSNLMKSLNNSENYSLRAPEDGKGEIQELAQSFNKMLGDIEARDKELMDYQETLEIKVEDRTRDLVLAKNNADKANAAKSEFLATMSHEIRTPMNGMLLMSELLATAELSPKYQRYADVIMKSGKSLLAIINDILDFSKIQSGKLELESVEIKTQEVVEDVMSLFWQKAKEKQLNMACYIAPDVPHVISSDPTRLNQILSNLVNNALKFTEHGSVIIYVDIIKGSNESNLLSFKVQDTGIGIEQENIAKVFESFSQADQSTTRKFGGTGLGLPICKKLVEAMGGEIFVTSILGEGASFSFTLPMSVAAEYIVEPTKVDKSVLVALDDRVSANLVAAVLAEYDISPKILDASELENIDCSSFDWVIAETASFDTIHYPKASQFNVAVTQLGDASIDTLIRSDKVQDVLSMPLSSIMVRQCMERLIACKPFGLHLLKRASAKSYDWKSYSNRKVLVVDDSAVNREVVIQALGRFDIEPSVVSNGFDAIHEFEHSTFDLVFMDCSMPDMDGYEATLKLREVEAAQGRSKTPIIALTAHIAQNIGEKMRDATMDDIVTKPFTIASIGKCLNEWLKSDNTNDVSIEVGNPTIDDEITAIDDETIFDHSILNNLKEIAGDAYEATFAQLKMLYLDSAPATFDNLVEAVNSSDLNAVNEASHALKSMSMNIGAVRLGSACKLVEDAAAAEDNNAVKARLYDLVKEFHRVVEAIKNEDVTSMHDCEKNNLAV